MVEVSRIRYLVPQEGPSETRMHVCLREHGTCVGIVRTFEGEEPVFRLQAAPFPEFGSLPRSPKSFFLLISSPAFLGFSPTFVQQSSVHVPIPGGRAVGLLCVPMTSPVTSSGPLAPRKEGSISGSVFSDVTRGKSNWCLCVEKPGGLGGAPLSTAGCVQPRW